MYKRQVHASRMFACSLALLAAAGCHNADDDQLQAKIDLGNVALGGRRYDAAVSDANAALKLKPGSAPALYLRARAEEDRPKPDPNFQGADFAKAQDDYRAALALKPDAAVAARCHAGLANIAFSQNDYDTALSEWSQGIDYLDRPDWKANAMFHVAVSQQRLGRFDDADRTFMRVSEQFPSSSLAADAMTRRGVRGFYVQGGDFSQQADADRALNNARLIDASAMQVLKNDVMSIRCGPFTLYNQALDVRSKLLASFPDATVTLLQPGS